MHPTPGLKLWGQQGREKQPWRVMISSPLQRKEPEPRDDGRTPRHPGGAEEQDGERGAACAQGAPAREQAESFVREAVPGTLGLKQEQGFTRRTQGGREKGILQRVLHSSGGNRASGPSGSEPSPVARRN